MSGKVGYITEDGDKGVSIEQYKQKLVSQGLIAEEDIVAESHCMHPNFLKD